MHPKLNASQVYRECAGELIGCESSEQLDSSDAIIGQQRAVQALRFGLDIESKGFNIYVSGLPGSGRTTATRQFLKEFAARRSTPDDWVYVNNFHDNLKPNAIRLPAGRAKELQKDMERLVEQALSDLRSAFESEEYTRHREEVVNNVQSQKQELLDRLNAIAREHGFAMQATPMGLITIPTQDGKPISEEQYHALSEAQKKEISERQKKVKTALENATRQAQSLDKNLREKLEELDQEVAEYAIQHHFQELIEKYQELDEVPHHIQHVREDKLHNLGELREDEEEQPQLPMLRRRVRQDPLRKYAVNVLVDNSDLTGAPVFLETNPTYNNLLGRVEQEAVFGALVTDFTLIRSGALHNANGGFLVLPLEELLRNPFAWEALKRALENEKIEIEDAGERLGFATKNLRPEEIPLNVKIVLIGRADLYQMLQLYDEKFPELFKVKADFDTRMDRTPENIQEYIAFVCRLCNAEKLHHLDRSALARVVEHGSRLVDDQEKLSTHFGDLADVIREASYYAAQDEAGLVSAGHVNQAIEARFHRSSLVNDRIQEMIARGTIMIATQGSEVGQVNGLSVLSLGDISFGQPSRITASLGLGKEGVVNIEREADLSGPIHTKGVLILSGYLNERYATDKPLSLSARLVFEQNYAGVEGDSASSTELYALLSALSGLPIKQGCAVTGSVNQKGEIQAIGGVNEKIEGFFEVCRTQGLTGEQGVLIPQSNIHNLMLKQEVRLAVEDGQFHIWAVRTVDEGISLLTGVEAGQRQPDGSFPADSVNARVDARLRELAEKIEVFGKDEEDHS
jgi:lon-related putative ATP-dependent protease